MTSLHCALRGAKNERVALSDVSVRATLRDLLSEVTVEQRYRNLESVNIEAVYTFPLPLDAVLLDVEVRLGERVLHGVVIEKKAAEARYEDAVADGDAAVMLEMLEPGLYTMNVGNLLAGETATISVRYALLYRWSGDRLRVLIPTTVAPRYGVAMHQPHQAPEASLIVENRFSLQLEIFGSLRDAQFDSPSHAVTLTPFADRTLIALEEAHAVMDRDFVLRVRAPRAVRSFAMSGADGDGVTAIASFQPFFSGLRKPTRLSLGLVIDCSGSMEGDSIQQAKRALDDILGLLEPHDHANIIAFGSHARACAPHLLACTPANVEQLRRFARALNADMGGTELGQALELARETMGSAHAGEVFVVTDGQVSEWERVVANAHRSGFRHFTVGVGSAVAESFVRELAAETGGACELVSPNEAMSERIVRHFERMRASRTKEIAVRWPEGATNISPSRIAAVYEGDTVIVSATLPRSTAARDVVLDMMTEQGSPERQALSIPVADAESASDQISTVARVAAARRLPLLDENAARTTALRYRLTSPYTNWIAVVVRAEGEKALEQPVLRKVPQTLAAGWGGTGSVASASPARMHPAAPMLSMAPMQAMPPRASRSTPPASPKSIVFDQSFAEHAPLAPYDTSSRVPSGDHSESFEDCSDALTQLIALINDDPARLVHGRLGRLLDEAGFGRQLAAITRLAHEASVSEEDACLLVVATLLNRDTVKSRLSSDSLLRAEKLSDSAETMLDDLRRDSPHTATLAHRLMSILPKALSKSIRGSDTRAVSDSSHAGAGSASMERFVNAVRRVEEWPGAPR